QAVGLDGGDDAVGLGPVEVTTVAGLDVAPLEALLDPGEAGVACQGEVALGGVRVAPEEDLHAEAESGGGGGSLGRGGLRGRGGGRRRLSRGGGGRRRSGAEGRRGRGHRGGGGRGARGRGRAGR